MNGCSTHSPTTMYVPPSNRTVSAHYVADSRVTRSGQSPAPVHAGASIATAARGSAATRRRMHCHYPLAPYEPLGMRCVNEHHVEPGERTTVTRPLKPQQAARAAARAFGGKPDWSPGMTATAERGATAFCRWIGSAAPQAISEDEPLVLDVFWRSCRTDSPLFCSVLDWKSRPCSVRVFRPPPS
jgi:hypothetical protein